MDDLDKLLNRPLDYYNVDGVAELSQGLMFLSAFLLIWLLSHGPQILLHQVWAFTFALVISQLIMQPVIDFGSKAIKKHITYPRTGFVEYRTRLMTKRGWEFLAIAFGAASFLFVGMIAVARHDLSVFSLVPMFGFVFAVRYLRFARTAHWKWMVLLAMIAGASGVGALPLQLLDSLAGRLGLQSAIQSKAGAALYRAIGAIWLEFAMVGALFMLSGAVTFWFYLRHTQAPVPEE